MKKVLLSGIWLTVAAYAIFFVVLSPRVGKEDHDLFSTYYELAWRFWRSGGLWAHYNPFLCGGRSLAADTQIPIYSPIPFLSGLLGPLVVLRLEMLLQLILGVWGVRECSRYWKASANGQLWACLVYAAGGGIVTRYFVGHTTLACFHLLPLFTALSYRISDVKTEKRRLQIFFYYLSFIYAAHYKPHFFIFGLPLILIETFSRSLLEKKPMVLGHLIIGCIWALGINFVHYFPAQQYFTLFPREDGTAPARTPLYTLFLNLLFPMRTIPNDWYGPGTILHHEFSVFVGPVALYFAWRALRAFKDFPEKSKVVSVLVLLFFSIFIGVGRSSTERSLFEPFTWFVGLWPGFSTVRVPVRFWFGAYFALILLSGLGFYEKESPKYRIAILLMGVLPLSLSALVNLSKLVWTPLGWQRITSRVYATDIKQFHSVPDENYSLIADGKASIECSKNMEAYVSPSLREGSLLGLSHSKNISVSAKWLAWNQIEFTGEASDSGEIGFNLNHHPFWKYEGEGGSIRSRLGETLKLNVHKGYFRGWLVYEDPHLKMGLWVSLLFSGAFLLWSLILSIFRCNA